MKEKGNTMQFGICSDPKLLRRHKEVGDLEDFLGRLTKAGVDYLEFSVGAVMTSDADFASLRELVTAASLPVPAFNGFLPAAQGITGPEVDLGSVLGYCQTALDRCCCLGGEVVVLGSAGARRVPAGFDLGRAERQFCEFCRALGPIAEDAGLDIAIEPLNFQEDNLVLSVTQGARLVEEIGHPRIRLLADLYHMTEEHEPVNAVVDAGPFLRHTHLADLGRVAPGYAANGEADFVGFFRGLQAGGYADRPDARSSFEGKLEDLDTQVGPMMRLLQARWRESVREQALSAVAA